jgi:hypothetical protein
MGLGCFSNKVKKLIAQKQGLGVFRTMYLHTYSQKRASSPSTEVFIFTEPVQFLKRKIDATFSRKTKQRILKIWWVAYCLKCNTLHIANSIKQKVTSHNFCILLTQWILLPLCPSDSVITTHGYVQVSTTRFWAGVCDHVVLATRNT